MGAVHRLAEQIVSDRAQACFTEVVDVAQHCLPVLCSFHEVLCGSSP